MNRYITSASSALMDPTDIFAWGEDAINQIVPIDQAEVPIDTGADFPTEPSLPPISTTQPSIPAEVSRYANAIQNAPITEECRARALALIDNMIVKQQVPPPSDLMFLNSIVTEQYPQSCTPPPPPAGIQFQWWWLAAAGGAILLIWLMMRKPSKK